MCGALAQLRESADADKIMVTIDLRLQIQWERGCSTGVATRVVLKPAVRLRCALALSTRTLGERALLAVSTLVVP